MGGSLLWGAADGSSFSDYLNLLSENYGKQFIIFSKHMLSKNWLSLTWQVDSFTISIILMAGLVWSTTYYILDQVNLKFENIFEYKS